VATGLPPVVVQSAIATLGRASRVRLWEDVLVLLSGLMEEPDELVRRIAAARPDLLLVAYGHPWQERWIARNRERLRVPVAIGVGGAFDFVAGRVRRAPAWMRRVHLEWLFRLLVQPWRARRMAVLPKFALMVFRERTEAGTAGSP